MNNYAMSSNNTFCILFKLTPFYGGHPMKMENLQFFSKKHVFEIFFVKIWTVSGDFSMLPPTLYNND